MTYFAEVANAIVSGRMSVVRGLTDRAPSNPGVDQLRELARQVSARVRGSLNSLQAKRLRTYLALVFSDTVVAQIACESMNNRAMRNRRSRHQRTLRELREPAYA